MSLESFCMEAVEVVATKFLVCAAVGLQMIANDQ
jgi:hypothetical protein